jgi:hypothetical protein
MGSRAKEWVVAELLGECSASMEYTTTYFIRNQLYCLKRYTLTQNVCDSRLLAVGYSSFLAFVL